MRKQNRSRSRSRASYKTPVVSFTAAVVTSVLFVFSGITATIAIRIPSLLSGIILVPAFVLLMACIHEYASAETRLYSRVGLLFAVGYSVLIGFNYYMQLTLATLPAFAVMFDMKSPKSIMWVIEILGYGFMSLSTLSAAWVFTSGGIVMIVKWLFVTNGVLGVGGMLGYALGLNMNILLGGLIAWDLIMPISTILLSIMFWKSSEQGRQ
jgi:hypothetical protein